MVPRVKPTASSSAELNTIVKVKRPAEVIKSAGARCGRQLSGSKTTAMAVVTRAQVRNATEVIANMSTLLAAMSPAML